MDGMFYSLEQTAKKLNKTEREVDAVVKEGRLRVFFDGPNQLFKVDEVESLLAEVSSRISEPKVKEPVEEPIGIEDEDIAFAGDEDTMSFFESSDEQEAVSEDIDDIIGLTDGEDTAAITEIAADTSADTTEVGDASDGGNEDDFLMLSDEQDESHAKPAVEESAGKLDFEDEIFADLSETLGLADSKEETSALAGAEDTTLNGGGVNILGESDGGYELASDTMGETKSASDFDGDSLEDIEEDVNLDSFGSGSGLLDLSLQADDTSLGGILDEIYTSDEEGRHDISADTEGSAMDVTAAAEEMFSEGDMALGESKGGFGGAAMMQGFEPAPDASSNMLGSILILPFVAIIYTTVVVIAGYRGFKPSILNTIEGYISYIFIGFIALAVVVSLFACFAGGDGTKEARSKKEKKPKAVKEQKPKKEKVKKVKK